MGILSALRGLLPVTATAMTDEVAKRIFKDYVETSTKHIGHVMIDVRELPHTKERTKAALLHFAARSPHLARTTLDLLPGLAKYQKNVAGRDTAELLDTISAEIEALTAEAAQVP